MSNLYAHATRLGQSSGQRRRRTRLEISHLLRIVQIILALLLQPRVQALRASEVCARSKKRLGSVPQDQTRARCELQRTRDATTDADPRSCEDEDPLARSDQLESLLPRVEVLEFGSAAKATRVHERREEISMPSERLLDLSDKTHTRESAILSTGKSDRSSMSGLRSDLGCERDVQKVVGDGRGVIGTRGGSPTRTRLTSNAKRRCKMGILR